MNVAKTGQATKDQIAKKNGNKPPDASHERGLPTFRRLTDSENAERFIARCGEDFHYLQVSQTWLKWTGKNWSPDKNYEINRRALDTVREFYREAADVDDNKQRQREIQHALKSEGRSQLDNMITLGRTLPGITLSPDVFDSDVWLIGCLNGTLDLRSADLRPARRDDLITQLLPVAYDPDATCPTWHEFLKRVMDGNDEMIAYLQRAIGYTLTGDTSEQIMFFLHGRGKNGKSTFVETLSALMGDYGLKTSTETLMSKKQPGISNDVAALKGKRFVFASETEEGRRLNEALIKDLTGGDTVSARHLYQESITFKPVNKIWLAGNHKPQIRGTDDGIWRRLHIIPFTVQINEKERDPHLVGKLTAELPGILQWAVLGAGLWQIMRLKPPKEIEDANKSYRAEMDILAAWIAECCVLRSELVTPSKNLYANYVAWCAANGESPFARNRFGSALQEQGCEQKKGTAGVHKWKGIGIAFSDPNASD